MSSVRRVLVALVLALGCVFCSDVASYASGPTVGEANTGADSWWGDGVYTYRSGAYAVTCTHDVVVPVPVYLDSHDATQLEVEVFDADHEATPMGDWVAEGSPNSVETSSGSEEQRTFEAQAGKTYSIFLTSWDPVADQGHDMFVGGLAAQFLDASSCDDPPVDPPDDPPAVAGVVSLSTDDRAFILAGLGLLVALTAANLVSGWSRG